MNVSLPLLLIRDVLERVAFSNKQKISFRVNAQEVIAHSLRGYQRWPLSLTENENQAWLLQCRRERLRVHLLVNQSVVSFTVGLAEVGAALPPWEVRMLPENDFSLRLEVFARKQPRSGSCLKADLPRLPSLVTLPSEFMDGATTERGLQINCHSGFFFKTMRA